jgi:hypothetical protein
LYNEQLANKDPCDNQQKQIIIPNFIKDIDLISFQFSGIEKVEHLQKDKDVKEDTEMNTVFVVPILQLDSY